MSAGREHGAEPQHEQQLATDNRARGQGQRRAPGITLGAAQDEGDGDRGGDDEAQNSSEIA